MVKILKNAKVYSPDFLGYKDILTGAGKILAMEDSIEISSKFAEVIDIQGKIVTPGLIDQHIHLTGAGGKLSFASMTPEITRNELIRCGTTTILGMLGTDGITKSLEGLYAKVKALDQEGISTYMLTGYFGYPTKTLMGSVIEDMIFIDKVIGCKTAISDERSSFPTDNELLKLLREVHVGGLTAGKGGILHVHLGGLESRMDILLDMVKKYNFPIRHISPTHVGRTRPLFEQAIEFAKLGGMIDISTGGTKFDMPYKQVLYALEKGVSMNNMTFSSDGNAGMSRKDINGNVLNTYKAPVDQNLHQVIMMIKDGARSISDAFKLITSNPARNLSLPHKGEIKVGNDADFCFFDDDFNLTDVISRSIVMMKDGEILKNNTFFQ
jgi:beta-aspartyl-dipeptidase (metallo-type)